MYIEPNNLPHKNKYRVEFSNADFEDVFAEINNTEAIKRALDWEKTHTVLVSKVILMDDNYKDVKCVLDKKMQ